MFYIIVYPEKKRRKERENLCISLSTQHFLQQQPLEKMAKKRNSNPNILNCVYCLLVNSCMLHALIRAHFLEYRAVLLAIFAQLSTSAFELLWYSYTSPNTWATV